jgi:hypothetical protein
VALLLRRLQRSAGDPPVTSLFDGFNDLREIRL